MTDNTNISDELLATYAEGNASQEERIAVRQYLMSHPDELEAVVVMMDEDGDLALEEELQEETLCPDEQEPVVVMMDKDSDLTLDGELQETLYPDDFNGRLDALYDEVNPKDSCRSAHKILPATAMAAQNIIDNLCAVRCEGIALRRLGLDVTDEELLEESKAEGWLQPEGTALHNIGRLSGKRGMGVAHRYGCTLEDMRAELQAGHVVIAAVDGSELVSDTEAERTEDIKENEIPDHVVVVESVNDNAITICDTSTPQQYDTFPTARFLDAWAASSFYLIIISKGEDYDPHPIDLSDVEISDDLIELREAIAENAHEVWAFNRKQEGWRYGPERDDTQKLHPDMIAYSQLPESEKLYDREMAINTIKLVKKLGWEIVKRK